MSKSHDLTTKNGGKFDFKDGGTYIGEWCDGRAHGFGIATGPNNQGEYSGDWSVGFENCGVYIWPSGNVYEGLWMKGKRHGEGIQIMGRWVYKGSFTTGFFGRYGVKSSLYTQSRYEGCWHLNEFDGYGIETCADGSTYSGMWFKNQRKGLGVSRSAQFGLANDFRDSRDCRPSMADFSSHYGECRESSANIYRDCSVNEIRNGFVLCFHSNKYKSKSPDSTDLGNLNIIKKSSHKNTNFQVTDQSSTQTDQTKSFKLHKKIMMRLRKKIQIHVRTCRSLSRQRSNDNNETDFLKNPPGSIKSTYSRDNNPAESTMPTSSGSSCCQGGNNSFSSVVPVEDILAAIPKHSIETYAGQWNANTRTGLGVAERSDGVKYIGEWQNNKRHGYGITCFSDNTREEGRYKDNVLCQQLNRKSRIFLIKHSRLKNLVDDFVQKALEVAQDAKIKAVETAYQRAQTALAAAISAEARAEDARKMSKRARETAKQIAPNFEQPGPIWELKRKKDEAASRSAIVLTKIQVHSPISSLSFDSASKKLEKYYDQTIFQQKINQKFHKPSLSPTKHRHYHTQFRTKSIANENDFSSEGDFQSSSEFCRRPNCRWLGDSQESPYLDLIWATQKKCSPIDQSPPSMKLVDNSTKSENLEILNSENKKSKPKLKSFKTHIVITPQEMPATSRSSHQDSGYYSMEPDSTQTSYINTSICMPLPILSFSANQKQDTHCTLFSEISPIKSLNFDYLDQYKVNNMGRKKSSIRQILRGSSMDESVLCKRHSKIEGRNFDQHDSRISKMTDSSLRSDLESFAIESGLENAEISDKIKIFDKNKSSSETKLKILNLARESNFKFTDEKDEKDDLFSLTRNSMSKRRIPALARSPPAFTHDDESDNAFIQNCKNYSMACSTKESLISFCSKLISTNVIESRPRSRIPISKFGSSKLLVQKKYSNTFSRSQDIYPKLVPTKLEKTELPADLTFYDLFSLILSAWTQYWMLKFRFSVMSSFVSAIKIWVEENLSICIILIINIILVLIFSHILLTKVNKDE